MCVCSISKGTREETSTYGRVCPRVHTSFLRSSICAMGGKHREILISLCSMFRICKEVSPFPYSSPHCLHLSMCSQELMLDKSWGSGKARWKYRKTGKKEKNECLEILVSRAQATGGNRTKEPHLLETKDREQFPSEVRG